MTYNVSFPLSPKVLHLILIYFSKAYLILAVVIGAMTGHYLFGSHMDVDAVLAGTADGRGMACH